jgi:hypothetical protein
MNLWDLLHSKSDKYKKENITSVYEEMDYGNITEFSACEYDLYMVCWVCVRFRRRNRHSENNVPTP